MARSVRGALPFVPGAADPPPSSDVHSWLFFTPVEARIVEAIVDRLIPPDELGPGGREAGCAAFIDRQLAGAFGQSSRLYTQGPFLPGLPTQGYQGEAEPARRYRAALAALDAKARQDSHRPFVELSAAEQDAFLMELEVGRLALNGGIDGRAFFDLLLQNTVEGYFADPIYGGNRGMAGWRMIGFPGARYDYRDHVAKHNQPYPRSPVSIAGASEWARR